MHPIIAKSAMKILLMMMEKKQLENRYFLWISKKIMKLNRNKSTILPDLHDVKNS